MVSGRKSKTKAARIMFEPNQMYPYLGPQLRLAGLMKYLQVNVSWISSSSNLMARTNTYGAVYVPNQFPRKFNAVAKPKAYALSAVLGYSPPSNQAYGAV